MKRMPSVTQSLVRSILALVVVLLPVEAAFQTLRSPTATRAKQQAFRRTRIFQCSSDKDAYQATNMESSVFSCHPQHSRRWLLAHTTAAALGAWVGIRTPPAAHAVFEGGIGGMGKTKPETGVVFLNPDILPTQSRTGLVTAELVVNDRVALVSFASPWPLLTTAAGLETRDLSTSDAAFCQVIASARLPISSSGSAKQTAAALSQVLQESVLAPQGKFGAYGAPSDIKVKPVADTSTTEGTTLYQLTFTSLTPSLRESDRTYYVSVQSLDQALVLLLVGSTAARVRAQQAQMRQVADSWQVVAAPRTAQKLVRTTVPADS